MVARAGLSATIDCKPRQARKGATVAVDSCAGVGRVRVAAYFVLFPFKSIEKWRLIVTAKHPLWYFLIPCVGQNH